MRIFPTDCVLLWVFFSFNLTHPARYFSSVPLTHPGIFYFSLSMHPGTCFFSMKRFKAAEEREAQAYVMITMF
jgi:hypothetical protein